MIQQAEEANRRLTKPYLILNTFFSMANGYTQLNYNQINFWKL